MRRSRFGAAIETSEVRDRASIRDALWFDFTRPETADEESLSDWRLVGLQHAPIILGITHVLVTITCTLLSTKHSFSSLSDNPFIPAVLVIMLDTATAAAVM